MPIELDRFIQRPTANIVFAVAGSFPAQGGNLQHVELIGDLIASRGLENRDQVVSVLLGRLALGSAF